MTPQEEADVEVLTAAMYVLSRLGRSDGASICAGVISGIRAGAESHAGGRAGVS